MSDYEEDVESSDEPESAYETEDEMEYVTVTDSDEGESEEENPRITVKQENLMLKNKLAHFQQDKSPLETLVFTSKRADNFSSIQSDLQRESALFAYY